MSKMSSIRNFEAWWAALHAITAGSIVLPIIAIVMGRFTFEQTAAHIVLAMYAYVQLRQYLRGGSMLSAFGRTLRNDAETAIERLGYAVVFAAALVVGLVISGTAVMRP
jgi:uncharacterized membrane protein YwaF